MNKKTPKPYHQTDHGPEIFPHRRAFTSEEQRWRKTVVGFVWEYLEKNAAHISPTVVLRENQVNYQATSSSSPKEEIKQQKKDLREQLTDILLTLRVVNEILKVQYGSPDWGNQPHVIDELVYILLTRRSKIEDASRHLAAIRERYTA
ncbi:MAG: hypothetical protein GY797_35985 [Deltaproteobacteria bacterium]|nr:hypothetical protein [Deltaproteobacteria bacterium]